MLVEKLKGKQVTISFMKLRDRQTDTDKQAFKKQIFNAVSQPK